MITLGRFLESRPELGQKVKKGNSVRPTRPEIMSVAIAGHTECSTSPTDPLPSHSSDVEATEGAWEHDQDKVVTEPSLWSQA